MKFNKQNKKAKILLSESIKMIIAVLSIFILIYLAVSLYGIFKNKTAREQAKETLKQIVSDIKTVKETGQERKYLVLAPKDWYLVNYEQGKQMPGICKGDNCLCMCPEEADILSHFESGFKDQSEYFYKQGLSKCDKERICQNVKDKIEFGDLITLYTQEKRIIGETAIRKQVNFISFLKLPMVIYLNKKDEIILLSTKSEEAPTPILNELFKKEIEFNQEKITFREFISRYITKDCTDENFQPTSEVKNFADKEMKDYLKGLEFDKKIWGLNINIQKIKDNVMTILINPWVYVNRDIPQSKQIIKEEELILCGDEGKNLIFIIEYIGTFEK